MHDYLFTLLSTIAIIGVMFVFLYLLKGFIMSSQEEIAARINAAADQADKAKGEIIAAVQSLKDEIANASVASPAIDAAVTRLEGSVAALDALNPDAAPVVVPAA